jgi:acyl-CoA dehydrogenase
VTAIDTFRQEAREWLDANCPESMRQPVAGFEDIYTGGRTPGSRTSGSAAVVRAHGRARLDRAALAAGVRRRRLSGEEVKVLREEMRVSTRAGRWIPSASPCSARRC